ncbi:MAG: flagellar hook-basal body complex protein FliE [Oscillospiraceae bacterium]|nr:flagellar hook-basal body complex protein FliE [Oscillospiraceae bacterium]
MNITPLNSYISPIGTHGGLKGGFVEEQSEKSGVPTFLDVFTQIYTEAVQSGQTVDSDRIRMMLGDADDLEQIQLNLQKAELATELFVNIRNAVLDSYNEIVRMQI